MKQLLIYAGAAYAVAQVLFVMAVMAAAAKPSPKFDPEIKNVRARKISQQKQPVHELELVS